MGATAVAERPKAKKPVKTTLAAQSVPLAPMLGETQGQFFDRAFRALKAFVPQVNQRTVEIIKLWCASQNDQDLRDAAAARFPEDRFTHFGPRCIFLQHEIPDTPEVKHPASGVVIRRAVPGTDYDRKALEQIVAFANYRIRNSGLFSAISDGHMPTDEEKASGIKDAEVLGYSGPFYIGLFGNIDPKWAIFSDEWAHNEDLQRFQKLQRRSPEIWHKEPLERRTMDPIAALGSEVPRLDSGMNLYCRRTDGTEVMRYSMSMALPGPTNTYVPGSETGKKKRYGANPMDATQNPPANAMDATQPQPGQDDQAGKVAASVASALAKLMPTLVQAVQDELSQANPTDGDAVPSDNEADPNANAEAVGATDDNTPRGIEPTIDAGDANQNNPSQECPPNSPESPIDEEHKKYSDMSPQCGMAYAAGHKKGRQPMTTNYSKGSDAGLAGVVATQANQIKALQKQMSDQQALIAQERTDAARYGRLVELSREYAFDPREEMELVTDMTDEKFDHFTTKTITRYAKRDSVEGLDLFVDPSLDVERYSRGGNTGNRVTADQVERYSREAEKICMKKMEKGEKPNFSDELDTILKANNVPV